jgi:hypothetical protein
MKKKVIEWLFKPLLKRNQRFKDIHRGETCYIIGNGSSIQHMDLSKFNQHITIGINMLTIHNQAKHLDLKYLAHVEPFFFYPYIKNPYIHVYQRNMLGLATKRSLKDFPDTELFTSISNCFGNTHPRSNYMYHFGERKPSKQNCDLTQSFSFMQGGFSAAIGLAYYLGFRKMILIGIDYLFEPIGQGHFYAANDPYRQGKAKNVYQEIFKEFENEVEFEVITDFGISPWLPSQTYQEYTGEEIRLRDNHQIVDETYLKILDRALVLEQYGHPIRKQP